MTPSKKEPNDAFIKWREGLDWVAPAEDLLILQTKPQAKKTRKPKNSDQLDLLSTKPIKK